MATANYSRSNLSKIYQCKVSNDFDFDDNLSNVTYALENLEGFYKVDKWIDNTTKAIGAIDVLAYNIQYKEWYNLPVYITVEGGHYSGMMFNIDASDIYDSGEYNETKTLENKIDAVCSKVEKVLEQYTTPLHCAGVFSNGEAIYSLA